MKVNIDTATNEIKVWNNGGGIPVQVRNVYGIRFVNV